MSFSAGFTPVFQNTIGTSLSGGFAASRQRRQIEADEEADRLQRAMLNAQFAQKQLAAQEEEKRRILEWEAKQKLEDRKTRATEARAASRIGGSNPEETQVLKDIDGSIRQRTSILQAIDPLLQAEDFKATMNEIRELQRQREEITARHNKVYQDSLAKANAQNSATPYLQARPGEEQPTTQPFTTQPTTRPAPSTQPAPTTRPGDVPRADSGYLPPAQTVQASPSEALDRTAEAISPATAELTPEKAEAVYQMAKQIGVERYGGRPLTKDEKIAALAEAEAISRNRDFLRWLSFRQPTNAPPSKLSDVLIGAPGGYGAVPSGAGAVGYKWGW